MENSRGQPPTMRPKAQNEKEPHGDREGPGGDADGWLCAFWGPEVRTEQHLNAGRGSTGTKWVTAEGASPTVPAGPRSSTVNAGLPGLLHFLPLHASQSPRAYTASSLLPPVPPTACQNARRSCARLACFGTSVIHRVNQG